MRAVSVVGIGLALIFAVGACVAFTDRTGPWILMPVGVSVAGATAFLAGRYSEPAWAVPLGVTVGLGAPIVTLFGNYFVYHYGIGGLESRDFGSPDVPGEYYILVSLLILSPFIAGASILAGFLAKLGNFRHPRNLGGKAAA